MMFSTRYLKNLSIYFLVLLLLFVGAIVAFTYTMHEVLFEQEVAADNNILNFLGAHVVSPPLTGFMKAVTYFASATFMQIAFVSLVVIYLLRKKHRRALEIAIIGLGGFLVNYCMKLVFHRIRPPHPLIAPLHNFSFPSGHATSGFIFYGLLAFLIWQTDLPKALRIIAAILLVLFSLLIGFSRVYLRVHYPSDVVAGFCVGFAWLLLAIWVMDNARIYRQVDAPKTA
jgi:undecaprenyl-diphosphatase